MNDLRKKWIFLVLWCGIVFVLDQVTKISIKHHFQLYDSIDLIGQYLRFTFIYNENAAFGLRIGNQAFFVVANLLASSLVIYYYFFLPQQRWFDQLALAIILGGAFGNLTDRLLYKKVIDFVDVGINNQLRWPVFNVADSAVSVGVTILILSMLLNRDSNQKVAASVDKESVDRSTEE